MSDSDGTEVQPWQGSRPLPRFFLNWRADFTPGGPGFTPTDFLGRDQAVPFVLMAAWLFCPETTEHRDGIFLTERFNADNADKWIAHFGGDVHGAEKMVNAITLYDFFTNADLDPYTDQDLAQLADSIAECWRGVLGRRYPDRRITVDLSGAGDAEYGPRITFWS